MRSWEVSRHLKRPDNEYSDSAGRGARRGSGVPSNTGGAPNRKVDNKPSGAAGGVGKSSGTPRRIIANRKPAQRVPVGSSMSTSPKTYSSVPLNAKKAVSGTDPAVSAAVSAQTRGAKPVARRRVSAGLIKPEDIIRIRGGVDRPMLLIIILLVCFGSVMVFSASFAYALQTYGDSYYFIKKQLEFIAVGVVGMSVAIMFDYRWVKKVTTYVFIAAVILLVAVLFTGLGSSTGTAERWLEIPGVIRFQPSELMKLALVLMLAKYIANHEAEITDYSNFWRSSWYGFFIPFAFTGLACALVAAEFHFSGTIILFLIGMVVIFAGGARKFWFFVGGLSAASLIVPAILLTDYAKERIDTWLHPENYAADNEIWQTLQGKYAVGSGGLFGVGLGYSRQKHLYVSQPQNDFIFSIICEELGFIGALAVIMLFAMFVWRGVVIALKAPDTFSSLVVLGIIGQVAIQATLNMMVVTNMIPNTGISLPFFSYGGTSLAMLLGEMGIVLCISRYSYQEK